MNTSFNSMAAHRYGHETTERAARRVEVFDAGSRTSKPAGIWHGPFFASATRREVTLEEARASREAWPLAAIERLIDEVNRANARACKKKGIQK